MNVFDNTVYHFLNQFAGHVPVLDPIMKFFAQYALELYAVLFIAAWLALPKRTIEHRHALVMAGLAGVLALVINWVIAQAWYRQRPFMTLPHGTFTQLIPHPADASFPSDHTSGSFGFASASWGHAPKWIRVSFTAIAILVMISRVYCGVHWPTDVLAGFVVGTCSGRLIWIFSKYVLPITKRLAKMFRYGPHDLS